MQYIIQENIFKEYHYDRLQQSLERLNLDYTTVRCFPFIDKISRLEDIPNKEGNYIVDELPDYIPDTDNVFCFGAIKLARVAAKQGWKPGSMMNSNHDYMVYKDYWKDNLLNYDSEIFKLSQDFGWKKDEVKFIRPTQDTKSFTGQVFTQQEWESTKENYLHNYRSEIFNEDTPVQVSKPKSIEKEIRFWVVNGEVITGSTYRDYNQYNINGQVYQEEYDFAQSMVDKFQLNEAFVIDICKTDNRFKIVEAGCINCAGFYNADLTKVIIALETHFNND